MPGLTEPATKNEVPRGRRGVALEMETQIVALLLCKHRIRWEDCLFVCLSVCDVVLGDLDDLSSPSVAEDRTQFDILSGDCDCILHPRRDQRQLPEAPHWIFSKDCPRRSPPGLLSVPFDKYRHEEIPNKTASCQALTSQLNKMSNDANGRIWSLIDE